MKETYGSGTQQPNVRRYTVADMQQMQTHTNTWNFILYQDRGLILALQGNFDEHRQRTQGYSPVHSHPHDELIRLVNGDYGNLNRARIEQSSRYLRIPAELPHGGDANGVWVSLKPNGFKFEGARYFGKKLRYVNGSSRLIIGMSTEGFYVTHNEVSELEICIEESPQELVVLGATEFRAEPAELFSIRFYEKRSRKARANNKKS